MPLTNEQAAYIAGILDGEGSISLVRSFANRTRGRYVYPSVRVANTDGLLVEWLLATVGCGARRYVSSMNNRCKPVHHICWACNEAIELLRAVLPFLIIKRDRARLVIELWERKEHALKEAGGYFGNGHPLPAGLVEFRESAFYKMKRLNKRGVT